MVLTPLNKGRNLSLVCRTRPRKRRRETQRPGCPQSKDVFRRQSRIEVNVSRVTGQTPKTKANGENYWVITQRSKMHDASLLYISQPINIGMG